VVAQAQ